MRPAPVLFASMFAAQAAFMTLAPVLPELARDLDVSLATAGQLGTVAGVAGTAGAIAITAAGSRLRVRPLLVGGLALLALGSVAAVLAPGFALLLAAMPALGAGMSAVLAGSVAAVAAWAPPDRRPGVLAWAIVGQPASWVVGMPLIGLVALHHWRLAFLAVPLAAALVALALVATRRRTPDQPAPPQGGSPAWRRREVRTWALGEALGFTAWNGTLLYLGALLSEGHGLEPGPIGLLLGSTAAAYFPGVWLARRYVREHARGILALVCPAAALTVVVLGSVDLPTPAAAVLITVLMALNGARGLAGSAHGLATATDRSVEVTGLRATAVQAGALLGAALGGLALGAGGLPAMTAVFAVAFVLAGLPYLSLPQLLRPAAAAS